MLPTEDFPQPDAHTTTALPAAVPPAVGSRQPTDVETVGVLHLINGEHYAGAERVQDLLAPPARVRFPRRVRVRQIEGV